MHSKTVNGQEAQLVAEADAKFDEISDCFPNDNEAMVIIGQSDLAALAELMIEKGVCTRVEFLERVVARRIVLADQVKNMEEGEPAGESLPTGH